MDFPKIPQGLRQEAGLTQEGLADLIHIAFAPISDLERGLTNPTFSSLLRIARGLEVDLSDLITRFEDIRASDSED